jgi:transposase
LLKRYRIRRITAGQILEKLKVTAIPVAPGTINAATGHLEAVALRLDLVNRQITGADARIDHLTGQLAANENTDAGQQNEQRDVTILRSLPGVGRIVLATLLAEASDALQRRDYHALRCLSGVAPITKRSGKSRIVIMRQAVHVRNGVYHWARVAIQHDPRSRAKYAALRARGHGHGRALRSVADRLLAVACTMLLNQTSFDPALASKTI